jgi:hypothetical protein
VHHELVVGLLHGLEVLAFVRELLLVGHLQLRQPLAVLRRERLDLRLQPTGLPGVVLAAADDDVVALLNLPVTDT